MSDSRESAQQRSINLSYDSEKPKEEPLKVNDHLMDAIRCVVNNHNAKNFVMPSPTTGLAKPFPGMMA
jgi:hypothetical protein